jgi:hypothetical protein
MQAELLLVNREAVAAANFYLPLFRRTLDLLESRRDAATNLLLTGDASNLMAPSWGAWLLPNGTRAWAYLSGMTVSYIAALDRVIQVCLLVNDAASAALYQARRDLSASALDSLLAPSGDYFVKSLDPNGTLHGVLGQAAHGYLDSTVNHDAVAFRVVNQSLADAIMARLVDPATGVRPYTFAITNGPISLDDMEASNSSWLWSYGTWVNGGAWSSCEGRMMLAYYIASMPYLALASQETMMPFAVAYRMDNPLVDFGQAVYQPDEPINIVYDNFAVPAALIRGLFEYLYTADSLTLRPHLPSNITALAQKFPIRFGLCRLYISTTGAGPVTAVQLDGAAWPTFNGTDVILPFSALPCAGATTAEVNVTIAITLGTARPAPPSPSHTAATAAAAAGYKGLPPGPLASTLAYLDTFRDADIYTLGRTPPLCSAEVLASSPAPPAAPPSTGLLAWFKADAITGVATGAPLARWPDSSGNGNDVVQATASAQPLYSATGFPGGLPAVLFDGAATFLANPSFALPAGSSFVGAFLDTGSATECCSGLIYTGGGCNGLSTRVVTSGCDVPDPETGNCTVLMIDWSGSGDQGHRNLLNVPTVASIVYNTSESVSFVNGCVESTDSAQQAAGSGLMIGSRDDQDARFFKGAAAELLIYGSPLTDAERAQAEAYLAGKWSVPLFPPSNCSQAPPLDCSLPASWTETVANMTGFVGRMRGAGFPDTLYESAHALLFLRATDTWTVRCALLNNGTLPQLPSIASQKAADALFVNTAVNLAQGLTTVVMGYAGSADPTRREIYQLFVGGGVRGA